MHHDKQEWDRLCRVHAEMVRAVGGRCSYKLDEEDDGRCIDEIIVDYHEDSVKRAVDQLNGT